MADGIEIGQHRLESSSGGGVAGHTQLPKGEKSLPADKKGSKWGFLVSPVMEEELAAGTCSETCPGDQESLLCEMASSL